MSNKPNLHIATPPEVKVLHEVSVRILNNGQIFVFGIPDDPVGTMDILLVGVRAMLKGGAVAPKEQSIIDVVNPITGLRAN